MKKQSIVIRTVTFVVLAAADATRFVSRRAWVLAQSTASTERSLRSLASRLRRHHGTAEPPAAPSTPSIRPYPMPSAEWHGPDVQRAMGDHAHEVA